MRDKALFALSTLALVWMHLAIRSMEKGVYGEELRKLPELQEIREGKHVGALDFSRSRRRPARKRSCMRFAQEQFFQRKRRHTGGSA